MALQGDSEAPPDIKNFTVAWIAPLFFEKAAACAMLDQTYSRFNFPTKNYHDPNNYTFGRIESHYVVIVSLPEGMTGVAITAAIVQGLLSSLPHIRMGLLVGIGAGVPGEVHDDDGRATPTLPDIRLGDIAVSHREDTNAGVVQYDFGKVLDDNGVDSFERKGTLGSPPTAALTALSNFRAEHEQNDSRVGQILQDMYARKKKMASPYGAPDFGTDRLFQATYSHKGTDDCRTCESSGEIAREPRVDPYLPCIHYGVIASGGKVIKNARTRKEIIERLKAEKIKPICFETEAAGLMDVLPCLVIRGISDYADSHKNDHWQRYAAATAAAYAKEFLTVLDPNEVERAPEIQELAKEIQIMHEQLDQVCEHIDSESFQKILNWICPDGYDLDKYNLTCKLIHQGTGQWFLHHANYQKWLNGTTSILFCPGNPGTGKTVISTLAAQSISKTFQQDTRIFCLYCDSALRVDQTLPHFMRKILMQLIRGRPPIPEKVCQLHRDSQHDRMEPTLQDIRNAIVTEIERSQQVRLVLDAVDECDPEVRTDLLHELRDFSKFKNFAFLVTSRDVPAITRFFEADSSIPISATRSDIESYISAALVDTNKTFRSFVTGNPQLCAWIVEFIVVFVDGRFLLARLLLELLRQKNTERALKDFLRSLSKPQHARTEADIYEPIYKATMERITHQPPDACHLAQHILAWLLFSKRPLGVDQLRFLLSISPGDDEFDPKNLIDANELFDTCAGLVIVDQASSRVGFVHATVAEFLITNHEHEKRYEHEKWLPLAQQHIAKICMTYISLMPSPDDPEIPDRIDHYMRLHAGHHFQAVEEHMSTLTKELSDLPGSRFPSDLSTFLDLWLRYKNSRRPDCDKSIWHVLARSGLAKTCGLRDHDDSQIDAIDECGRTPLICAANWGHESTVRFLLATKRVDVNKRAPPQNQTALHKAAQKGHVGTIEALLQSEDIDPNLKDHLEKTPLYLAMEYGSIQSFEAMLKDNRVDLKIECDGKTVIEYAMQDYSEYCAASRAPDASHTSASLLTIARDKLYAIAHIKPKQQDKSGRTPLHVAALERDWEFFTKLCIKCQVDIFVADENGDTALHYLASERSPRTAVSGTLPDRIDSPTESETDLARNNAIRNVLSRDDVFSGFPNGFLEPLIGQYEKMGEACLIEIVSEADSRVKRGTKRKIIAISSERQYLGRIRG